MKRSSILVTGLLLATLPAGFAAAPETPLSEAGQKLEARYADQLKTLGAELSAALPKVDEQKKTEFLTAAKDAKTAAAQQQAAKAHAELGLTPVLADKKLDAKLVKFVVLRSATPKGLAGFAQQGAGQAALIDKLLADPVLMQQMLVADGAKDNQY
ncbi:MAG TPA: hypothetical protein VFY13_09155, partial [Luteolibacter sp.]|nr:hypothetical protein [Luteolibacter sp.]